MPEHEPNSDVVVTNSPTGVTFSNEEAMSAAIDEQSLAKDAQIEHLIGRNYFLRALTNRLTAELGEAGEALAKIAAEKEASEV